MLWSSLSFIVWALLVMAACEFLARPRMLHLAEFNFLVSLLGACLGVVFYGLSVRRLKDLNMSPWLVKVLAFPVLALILMPYLLLVSGPQRENQYGSAQPSSSFSKIAGAVVLLFVAMNVSFAAVVNYYKTRSVLGGYQAWAALQSPLPQQRS
jgi:uncharacterized membrane protein YhaH (DUF805 family)